MISKIRFIYFPGLISLVGILAFILLSFKYILPTPQSVITYFTPADTKLHDSFTRVFSKYLIIDEITSKRKVQITLDDDKITNQKKLTLIRYEAQKLKYTNDTSSVILITLTNDITYSEFISVLNICLMDDHKRYAAYDDKFVIFGEHLPVVKQETPLFPFIYL